MFKETKIAFQEKSSKSPSPIVPSCPCDLESKETNLSSLSKFYLFLVVPSGIAYIGLTKTPMFTKFRNE